MSQDYDEAARDGIAEQAYGRLAAAWDPQQQAVTDDEDVQVREQIETLAMLAYSLEPEAPSVSVKQRLMAAAMAAPQPVAELPAAEQPIPGPALPARDPVDITLRHAVAEVAPEAPAHEDPGDQTLIGYGGSTASNVVPIAPRQSGGWATMALAAALALCLVGLGYLYSELNSQKALYAVQQERLAELPRLEATFAAAQQKLRTMHDQLAMVNTVARQAYPLHTVEASLPAAEAPIGRVFVCGQHQQWYLTVSGLEPAPSGQSYHLWFMTDDGPVDAGEVEFEGGVAGLQDLSMPSNTKGFSVTLEPGGVSDSPRGRLVLIGDSPVKL